MISPAIGGVDKRLTSEPDCLPDEDCYLMMRVGDDDPCAFEQIVGRYQASVVKWLSREISNQHVVEELAQDVFLRLYRARHSYTPTAKLSTWIYVIVKNVARNEKRARARRSEFLRDDFDSATRGIAYGEDPNSLEPLSMMEVDERRSRLLDAIARLNENQRRAIILNRFHFLNYKEVAAKMDLSPQAVKSLLARARSNLGSILKAYVQGSCRDY